MSVRIRSSLFLVVLAILASACDKIPLFAPTDSSITITSASRILPINGSTEITAVVLETGGNPVQNGTTVRFTTTLGRVDPIEVQTRNGIALTTFFAGDTSGLAIVSATSGGAGAGAPADGAATTNVIEFTIGAAAVSTVSLRTNPTSVPATGGTVDVFALVLGVNGQPLPDVPVTFTSNQGSLSTGTATTGTNGEATVRLTTSVESTVNATAGIIAAATGATVTVLGTPGVTLTCTGSGAGTTTCTQTTGTAISFTANVGANSTTLTSATLEFGDGMSTALGGLSAATTVSHSYASVGTFTATLRGTDVNGQATNASVAITITAPAPIVPIGVTLTSTSAAADPAATVGNGQRVTFSVAVTPTADADLVESYTWDFGDGTSAVTTGNTSHVYTGPTNNGRTVVTVTVRTSDGRSATGRTEIIVSGLL